MSNRIFSNMEYPPNYYSGVRPSDYISSGDGGFWYDFGDWNNMFQDTAMTTKITAAGQKVAAIKDKGVNARHIFQATTSKMGTASLDGSGNKYLDFDAASVQCYLSSNAGSALATCWGAIVFERENSAINQRLLAMSTTGNDVATANDIAITGGAASQHFLIRAGANVTDTFVNGSGNSPFGFYEYQRVPNVFQCWKDHVIGATDTSAYVQNAYSSGKNCIGVQGVSNATGTAAAFDGKLYQMIHCGVIPDAAGKAAIETWFNTWRY